MCVRQQVKEKTCLASPTLSVLQTSDRFEQDASVTNDATGQTRKSNYPVTTCGGRQLLGDVINSSLTVRVHRSRTMFWNWRSKPSLMGNSLRCLKSNISKSFFRIKNICRFKDTVSYFHESLECFSSSAWEQRSGEVLKCLPLRWMETGEVSTLMVMALSFCLKNSRGFPDRWAMMAFASWKHKINTECCFFSS